MSARLRLGAIAVGCSTVAITGCTPAVDDNPLFPDRIVTPLCANAHPPILIEVLRAVRDPQARKPSADVRYYLVDLRIRRKDREDLWLLVNQETFPSAVDSVTPNVADHRVFGEPRRPPEVWRFVGNDIVRAYPLGRAAESSFENLEVGTGDSEIPVTFGTIEVADVSPREWVRRTGGRQPNAADEPRAPADFEPHCTTWIDVTGESVSRAH